MRSTLGAEQFRFSQINGVTAGNDNDGDGDFVQSGELACRHLN